MTVSRVPNVEGGIQPTIVTAKGDLITAVANANPARLGVGSDGQLLTADSTSATGLSYQNNFAAGKNKIINGDFRINQRAFSTTTTALTYGFDRWRMNVGGSFTCTYSAQTFTPGTAPVAGYEAINFARMVTTANSGAGDYAILSQLIEDVRTFAGSTVTVSFWAKAASGTPKVGVEFAQNFGSGGSAQVDGTGQAVTLTTSWARYSVTITVPSVSGKTIGTSSYIELNLWTVSGSTYATRSGSIGNQAATVDIWGVQVEAGSTATAFQTATGTIQGELAACQRYYEKSYEQGVAPATATYNGMNVMQFPVAGTGNIRFSAYFKVEKRAYPTMRLYDNAGNLNKVDYDFTANKTGTAVSFPKFVDVYSDGSTSKFSMGYHFTADAEL